MRVILTIAAGLTLSILAHIIWQPTLDRRMAERTTAWLLTRIPPATHPDCTPRYRYWKNGIETWPSPSDSTATSSTSTASAPTADSTPSGA